MNTISKVQDAITSGDYSFAEIAEMYNMTISDVEMIFDEMMEQMRDYYSEPMDGDFDSAMASAGFGTDEDYGYFGDEF
jgi:predicted HTH domain antitoxin